MWFRSIISGEQRGMGPDLCRLALRFLAWIFAAVINIRNRLYDAGWLRKHQLPAPVICVGNLTVGGTGKTPMAIWLCRRLHKQGKQVAILTRGYKGDGAQGNDETQLLQQALPQAALVVDHDRVRGGRRAIREFHPDVLVLDDGMQHRRLHRDLDIVMIDSTCPFGYEALLPRGLLREPMRQLRRADIVVLSRSDLIGKEPLAALTKQIDNLLTTANADKGTPEKKVIVYSRHLPVEIFDAGGVALGLTAIKGKRVLAFCGIGQPEAFVCTLSRLGAEVVATEFFDDHHRFDATDAHQLALRADKINADCMVTTEKDWVKIKGLAEEPATRLYWLKIEMVLTEGEKQLCDRLDSLWPTEPKNHTLR